MLIKKTLRLYSDRAADAAALDVLTHHLDYGYPCERDLIVAAIARLASPATAIDTAHLAEEIAEHLSALLPAASASGQASVATVTESAPTDDMLDDMLSLIADL